MKIVVTGALGHIGSRLIREIPCTLPEADIILLDNLSTYRYCSLFSLPAEGHYRFIEADVLTADLGRVFDGADVVIHLAAITNATDSFEMKEQVERVNCLGTERVAKAYARNAAAHFFILRTCVFCSLIGLVTD